MNDTAPAAGDRQAMAPAGGLRGWLATLPPRDRTIYATMLAILLVIVGVYVFAALREIIQQPPVAGTSITGTVTTSQPAQTARPVAAATLETPTPESPTPLPTSKPTATPQEPTATPRLILQPTSIDAGSATASADKPSPGATAHASATPAVPDTGKTSTSAIIPTPTEAPSTAALPQATPIPPQQTPAGEVHTERLTLYFIDSTGALYVPVEREVRVENRQVARAALRELIAGPRGSLQPVLLPDVKLLDLTIANGTATVNFDRAPTSPGDIRGYYATVLTLTEFVDSIQRVQFQINGQSKGLEVTGPVTRPVVNPINPDNLPPYDYAQTTHLPLYFLAHDGRYDIRLIRLIPKTRDTARATVNALLEGPNGYTSAVQHVIPAGTQLIDIGIDRNNIVTINFNQAFASAAPANRPAIVRTIVESLTALKTSNGRVAGVQFKVEGNSLADQWGEQYRNPFGRPIINPNS